MSVNLFKEDVTYKDGFEIVISMRHSEDIKLLEELKSMSDEELNNIKNLNEKYLENPYCIEYLCSNINVSQETIADISKKSKIITEDPFAFIQVAGSFTSKEKLKEFISRVSVNVVLDYYENYITNFAFHSAKDFSNVIVTEFPDKLKALSYFPLEYAHFSFIETEEYIDKIINNDKSIVNDENDKEIALTRLYCNPNTSAMQREAIYKEGINVKYLNTSRETSHTTEMLISVLEEGFLRLTGNPSCTKEEFAELLDIAQRLVDYDAPVDIMGDKHAKVIDLCKTYIPVIRDLSVRWLVEDFCLSLSCKNLFKQSELNKMLINSPISNGYVAKKIDMTVSDFQELFDRLNDENNLLGLKTLLINFLKPEYTSNRKIGPKSNVDTYNTYKTATPVAYNERYLKLLKDVAEKDVDVDHVFFKAYISNIDLSPSIKKDAIDVFEDTRKGLSLDFNNPKAVDLMKLSQDCKEIIKMEKIFKKCSVNPRVVNALTQTFALTSLQMNDINRQYNNNRSFRLYNIFNPDNHSHSADGALKRSFKNKCLAPNDFLEHHAPNLFVDFPRISTEERANVVLKLSEIKKGLNQNNYFDFQKICQIDYFLFILKDIQNGFDLYNKYKDLFDVNKSVPLLDNVKGAIENRLLFSLSSNFYLDNFNRKRFEEFCEDFKNNQSVYFISGIVDDLFTTCTNISKNQGLILSSEFLLLMPEIVNLCKLKRDAIERFDEISDNCFFDFLDGKLRDIDKSVDDETIDDR